MVIYDEDCRDVQESQGQQLQQYYDSLRRCDKSFNISLTIRQVYIIGDNAFPVSIFSFNHRLKEWRLNIEGLSCID